MQMCQFRCEECGVLFEAQVYKIESQQTCDFCGSTRVKKLCMVAASVERDDEALLDDEH